MVEHLVGEYGSLRVDRVNLAIDAVEVYSDVRDMDGDGVVDLIDAADRGTGTIICNVQRYNPTPAQLAATPAIRGQASSRDENLPLASPVGLDNTIGDCMPFNVMGNAQISPEAAAYIMTPKWGEHRRAGAEVASAPRRSATRTRFGAGGTSSASTWSSDEPSTRPLSRTREKRLQKLPSAQKQTVREDRRGSAVTEFLSAEQILANARALAPEIAARAPERASFAVRFHRLVDKLKAAGCFRVMFPKSWGGPEMSLPMQLEMVEALAHADTAVAWCVKIGTDSGLFAAWLTESAARELYPDIDFVTAGQAPPNGRALKVDGGYRVNGRWGFASGCTHADVMIGGCVVEDGRGARSEGSVFGPVEVIHVLAPASSWEIEDTWYATGLAGSGSHHYSAKDLFVPAGHALELAAPSGRDEPLYRLPITASVSIPMAGVPLGLARRAIDELCALAGRKIIAIPPPPALLKNLPRVRLAVARAESLLGAARAYVYETVERLWEEIAARGDASMKTRRDVGLSRIHAHRMACEVAQLMYDTAGPAAVYASSPLDRLLRDAVTINQHLLFNDGVLEELGAMALGEDVATRFV